MKTTIRHSLLLVTLAICVCIAGYALSLRRGLRQEEQSVTEVTGRMAGLQSDVRALRHEVRQLGVHVMAQSNRADRAEALAAEERSTQEPLREQVSRLMAEKVGVDARLRETDEQLAKVRQELGAARDEKGNLQARLTQTDQEANAARQQLAEVQARLAKAEAELAEVKKATP